MKKLLVIIPLVILVAGAVIFLWGYNYVKTPYKGKTIGIYIPRNSSQSDIKTLLSDSLGTKFGSRVATIWSKRGGSAARATGYYEFSEGETALQAANRLRSGAQTPVTVVIRPARTLDEMMDNVSSQFEFTTDEFRRACDSILALQGFTAATYPAAIIPDNYEFYWYTSPAKVVNRLLDYRRQFWNETRTKKAAELGLTPVQVATLASIVEEESAKLDERPTIARLYLNRLKRGMRLQADPTVKYAVGDPTLQRILQKHLDTPSPYNTYLIDGLPPGPIRIPEKSTLDAVLNAPENPYLYMCAREDLSGYHNFARDLATHNANARRYHAALNKLNIR